MPRNSSALWRSFLLGLVGLALFAARSPVALAANRKPHPHSSAKKKSEKRAPVEDPSTSKPTPSEALRTHPQPADGAEEMATRGPTRLDFDDRLIQGQGSKVGAVYLYDRKNLPLRSMVRQRVNFRDEIVSDAISGAVVE